MNLESPFSDMGEGICPANRMNLTASTESVAALEAANIDVVSIVNNHSMDAGAEGAQLTRTVLAEHGILALEEEDTPQWVGSPEVECAFFAWQDVEKALPLEEAVKSVTEISATGKCVIVSLHWGNEYQSGMDARQVRLAQAFADAGAWIVWGHHPHVLQPLRWLQGTGRTRKTLVMSSLGNALFDQVAPPDVRRAAGILVVLNSERIVHVECHPFMIDPNGGRVEAAGASEAEKIMSRLGDVCAY